MATIALVGACAGCGVVSAGAGPSIGYAVGRGWTFGGQLAGGELCDYYCDDSQKRLRPLARVAADLSWMPHSDGIRTPRLILAWTPTIEWKTNSVSPRTGALLGLAHDGNAIAPIGGLSAGMSFPFAGARYYKDGEFPGAGYSHWVSVTIGWRFGGGANEFFLTPLYSIARGGWFLGGS